MGGEGKSSCKINLIHHISTSKLFLLLWLWSLILLRSVYWDLYHFWFHKNITCWRGVMQFSNKISLYNMVFFILWKYHKTIIIIMGFFLYLYYTSFSYLLSGCADQKMDLSNKSFCLRVSPAGWIAYPAIFRLCYNYNLWFVFSSKIWFMIHCIIFVTQL